MTKAVIFDMGGVLVDLDFPRSVKDFADLGFAGYGDMLDPYKQKGLVGEMEEGLISGEEFIDTVLKECRPGTTREQAYTAFKHLCSGMPKQKIDYVASLSERYPIYLLSNNNPISAGYFIELCEGYGHKVEDIFLKLFYSFEMKLLKPGREIYAEAIRQIGFEPGEMLFIDDSAANVKAACEMGIDAVLYKTDEDLAAFVEKNIKL